ncbi:Phosphohydrolase [Rubrivivax sp. A210]|uniref:HD-GYP domain-containing protein n=1 Tax=Rubrivivax sp. A210 TaxID=2772301 RepID=UPI001919374F|nr:HD-GYP domain-containing protein [Rubrivivax sp. A210]CAD5371826.1 Phosphohydrolase [Rubrivivax sp. A210]
MSATIAVDELRVGMYIQLEGGWLSHPFPLSSFKIASADQIATLRGLGLLRVRWVPEKSDLQGGILEADVPAAPQLPPDPQEAAATERRRRLAAQREAVQLCERQHAEAARAWRDACDAIAAQPREAGRGADALTRAMLSKLLVSDEIGIRLIAGGPDRAAAHALNVGVVSLLIGRSLGLADAELLELGVGALMHDIGKQEVPDRFRHQDENFNTAETNAYREHVGKGVALGLRMGLPGAAMTVLAQHHEVADGSGFPMRLALDRMSLGARLVSLVDRYDNLCNPQARGLALTPHEAVSVLFAQGRKRYDAQVLNAFIRLVGVYPAGSLVQLTDDRHALVIGVNSSRTLKPRVLVHDARVPRGEALVLDLEREPDLGIRRSLPPSKLPPDALSYLDPKPRVVYFFEPLHGDELPREQAA